jgi:hypothetical protein
MEGVDLELIDTSVFGICSDDLFARYLRREKFLREQKSALSHRNKQQSGAISKADSKRDAECKSALAVFFSFVQQAVKPETLDIRYLFEKDVLEAWFIFYSGRVSPSTVGNNAKYLSLFFNFFNGKTLANSFLQLISNCYIDRACIPRLFINFE